MHLHFIMAFNNLHYLLSLVGLPFGIYFFFTALSTGMRKTLEKHEHSKRGVGLYGNPTQREFLHRQCYGFHNREDWKMPPSAVLDNAKNVNEDIKKEVKKSDDILYRTSCCNVSALKAVIRLWLDNLERPQEIFPEN